MDNRVIETKRCKLKDIADSRLEIEGSREIALPNAMIGTNLADTNPFFARHMLKDVYCARTAHVDAITLVGLPAGGIVFGGGHFLTMAGGHLVEEQYPPYIGSVIPKLGDILDVPRPMVEVKGEHLLVGRFGISTWGHWLGELLPKILLAEKAFPGRFKYVLPKFTVDPQLGNSLLGHFRQSLIGCGIGEDQLFVVDDANNYAFDSLFALTPLWSDHIMHPAASQALRDATSAIPPGARRKLAVLRDPSFGRVIANGAEVHALLKAHGFEASFTGLLSFNEQVSAFKGADSVFGVLGSDLTNLLFSKEHIEVITAAPDSFGDRFFYALVLDRNGRMADLRGPIIQEAAVIHKSTFEISLATIENTLSAMAR